MSKFSTSVFNKVVRWQESDEVENGYAAYNFRYLASYLHKFIKIGENWTKFWQTILHSYFLNTVYTS